MTYEDIISIGWEDRGNKNLNDRMLDFIYPSKYSDYHIMSVCLGIEEEDGIFDSVFIKCVNKDTYCNIWENSETHFYGQLKTKEELYLIMQFLGIVKYVGIKL